MVRTYRYTAPDGVEHTVETFLTNFPSSTIIGVRKSTCGGGWQPVFNPSYPGGYRTVAVAITR